MARVACPHCSTKRTKLLDVREVKEGVRRRYECLRDGCKRRFSTLEQVHLFLHHITKTHNTKGQFAKCKQST